MALITYILIAIPVCLLAIILWLYFNYWKYKRKNHFIFLILLFYPVLSYAQYMDKTQCKISFSSHANQAGKLEYTQDGIIYRFTPESNAWKITIKNNTNKNARINWEKGSFIINGKASGISLYPFTSDDPPTDVIKEKSEITRTVTASNLIKGKKVNKIYSKRNLKRNGLRREIADMADCYIKIPMLGQVESLNAAIASSVLMFEAARQRRKAD